MYIQIFILVKAAFLLQVIQGCSLIIKNGQTKQGSYFDETNEKSVNYCNELMDYIGTKLKTFMCGSHWHNISSHKFR